MICYHCGAELGAGRQCRACGVDVKIYKKMVRTSNAYYNEGLERARNRNLTGAIECLETSLQYNKRNTNARNLLGLCYIEMGEVCEALSQWLVSKNIQSENNASDRYLDKLRGDRNRLDAMNQAVKKYNQALEQAKNEGVDLAVITLKRVIKQSPKLVKAHVLLGLLYLQQEEYSHAIKSLKQAMDIDHGNLLAQYYLRRAKKLSKNSPRQLSEVSKEKGLNRALPHISLSSAPALDVEADDVEIRNNSIPRSSGEGMHTLLGVIAGVAAAIFMYQFVVMPTINRNQTVARNQLIAAYDTKLSARDMELQSLTDNLTSMQSEKDELMADMEDYTGDSGLLTQYEIMMDLLVRQVNGDEDYESMYKRFAKLNRSASRKSGFIHGYDALYERIVVSRLDELLNHAVELVDSAYYAKAIPEFEDVLKIDPSNTKAMWYLGVCYQHRRKPETAKKYWQRIVNEFPDSEYYEQAVAEVGLPKTEGADTDDLDDEGAAMPQEEQEPGEPFDLDEDDID